MCGQHCFTCLHPYNGYVIQDHRESSKVNSKFSCSQLTAKWPAAREGMVTLVVTSSPAVTGLWCQPVRGTQNSTVGTVVEVLTPMSMVGFVAVSDSDIWWGYWERDEWSNEWDHHRSRLLALKAVFWEMKFCEKNDCLCKLEVSGWWRLPSL